MQASPQKSCLVPSAGKVDCGEATRRKGPSAKRTDRLYVRSTSILAATIAPSPRTLRATSVARARTPAELAGLRVEEVDRLIYPCTFHEAKAAQLVEIARRTVELYGGELPADSEVLCSFRGVGPKCANLALGISGAIASRRRRRA